MPQYAGPVSDDFKSSGFYVDEVKGTTRALVFQSGGKDRWRMNVTAEDESGGDNGSNLEFIAVGDDGTQQVVFRINRKTGIVQFVQAPSTGGSGIPFKP